MIRLDLAQIDFAVRELFSDQLSTIFEIGSRDGVDTFQLAQAYNINPKKCFIFEPHPVSFENIKKQFPSFQLFNVAISDKTGVVEFNAATYDELNPGMSSLLETTSSSFKSSKIEVEAWTMDDFLEFIDVESIDICKIDVEGFTYQVLKGFENNIKKVKIIQLEVELEELWKGQKLFPDIHRFLTLNGFYLNGYNQLCDNQADVCYVNKQFLKV